MDGLLIIQYKNTQLMNNSLARLSCYLEDPVWGGQIIESYRFQQLDVMAKKYHGHNIKVDDLTSIYQQLPDPTKAEKTVYQQVKNYRYLVAYVSDKDLAHELQHAKYYLDQQYNRLVNQVWNRLDNSLKTKLKIFLEGLGYNDDVLIDEFQAYLTTEPINFFRLKKYNKQLQQIKQFMVAQ